MSDDHTHAESDPDDSPASLQYPEQRLRRADRLMERGPEGRREAMLIYRDLADMLSPEDPRDAARIARIAAAPSTVDERFESLFGRLAVVSDDPAQRAVALVAAGRIASQRGDFHRAEAGFRRALKHEQAADGRVETFQLLTTLFLAQGREHEGLAAATAASGVTCDAPVSAAYGLSHLIGARVAAEDWHGVLRDTAAWQAECDRLGIQPSLYSVAFHASHACVRLGDVPGATAWLARIRVDEVEPAHAAVLRPMVTLRTAQIAAASGAVPRAADLAASVARNRQNDVRTRADAIAFAAGFLCAAGATPRALGFAEEWLRIVTTGRDRVGAGIVIRHSSKILAALASATDALAPPDLLRGIARLLTTALADRAEEIVRHATDHDVPPLPPGDPALLAFRRTLAGRLGDRATVAPEAQRGEGDARARLAAALGAAPLVCRGCLCVLAPDAGAPAVRIPAGQLVAHLPGTRITDTPCAGCAADAAGAPAS